MFEERFSVTRSQPAGFLACMMTSHRKPPEGLRQVSGKLKPTLRAFYKFGHSKFQGIIQDELTKSLLAKRTTGPMMVLPVYTH